MMNVNFLCNVYISISIAYLNSKKNIFFVISYSQRYVFCLLHTVTKEYAGQGKAVSVFLSTRMLDYRSSLSTKPGFSVR